MFPAFVAAEDKDFDPEKINRYFRLAQRWKTDGIFFGGHDHVDITANATVDETLQLAHAVAMMIGETLG